MASSSRGREYKSTLYEDEHIAKRHAGFMWPPMSELKLGEDGLVADGSRNPNVWMGPGVQMPIPSPMGIMPMPPFPPMMLHIPNAGDPRQLEAYKAAVENAMMNRDGHHPPLIPPLQPTAGGRPEHSLGSARIEVLGTYPADTLTLREHVLHEDELFDELHERVTERDHFWTVVSLLERYFKGALSAPARAKISKMVQTVLDDRATSVDESRRLKHVLEAMRNAGSPGHNGSHVDVSYLQQLTAAHEGFVSQYGKSGKVK